MWWRKSQLAVLWWSQILRCAMFVFFCYSVGWNKVICGAVRLQNSRFLMFRKAWSLGVKHVSLTGPQAVYRFISPLIILVPQDSNITLYAQACWLCCVFMVLYLPLFCLVKAGHGFYSPCGSHQLLVFLKYSVCLKLLAQLVHYWEC